MTLYWNDERIEHRISNKIINELNNWYYGISNKNIKELKEHILDEDLDILLSFFDEEEWQEFFKYLKKQGINIWNKDEPEAIGLMELINNYLEIKEN